MEKKESKITGLLALVVFAVFALCVLGVLLTGAKTYQGVVDRGEQAYALRTAAQYLSTRVRQSDSADSIALEDFGGTTALVLRQKIDGETYATRIYCHGGYLRELFTAETGSFSPEDGETLLEMEDLQFSWEENGLSARFVIPEEAPADLFFYLRCREVLP